MGNQEILSVFFIIGIFVADSTALDIQRLNTASGSTGNTTLTINHELLAGQSRIVVVGISVEDSQGVGRTTSITYGGLPMHAIAGSLSTTVSGGTSIITELYYLLESELPGTGNTTLSITHNGNDISAGVTLLGGVQQSTPDTVSISSALTPTQISTSITTTIAGSMIVDVIGGGHPQNRGVFVAGVDQSESWDANAPSSQSASSTRIAAVPGAYNLLWDWQDNGSTLNRAAHSVVVLSPQSGGTPPTNQAPQITAIADQSVVEQQTKNVGVSASDSDGDAVTLSLASGQPGFVVLTDNGDGTGSIALSPGSADSGTYTVTVNVSDGALTDSTSFTLTVVDEATPPINQAPQITAIADQSVVEQQTKNVGVSASDLDGDSVTLSLASGQPSFVVLTDNGDGTGSIALSPGSADSGTYTVTVNVSDGALTDSTSFTLTVVDEATPPTNQAPQITAIADQSVVEQQTKNVGVTASDSDGDAVTLSLAAGQPGFVVLTDNGDGTGSIALSPGLADSGSYTVTVNVSDGALTDSTSFTLTVVDEESTDANPTGTLNDTGITSFTDSTEDGNHGRDVTFNDNSNGHAGFDYTKIGTSGTLLQGNGQASCVKDNVTGLIWEVKTNDSGLHDKDDVYSWYNTLNTAENLNVPGFDRPSNTAIRADVSNSNVNGSDDVCFGYDSSDPDNTAKLCNTQAYVARVNTAGLCGASDWRIPSREELRSLLKMDNMQIKGGVSYIDSDYFPNNQASYKVQCYDYFEQIGGVYTLKASAASDPDYQTYCSNFTIGDDDVTRGRGFGYATANSSVTKENSSWTMYFDDFTVAHGIIKDELRYVRLVRGAKLATNASSRYTAQGNGTVADNITGLTWKRCLEGYLFDSAAASCSVDSSDVSSFTWAEALQRAQTVANDNGVVWRVPNMKELGSITKHDVVRFAIDTDAFPDTPTSGRTWTASPHTGTGSFVWTITI